MFQILVNLVKNAVKFTVKGSIVIRASYDKDNKLLLVEVEDTGVGIELEELPRLFKKFGKLHRTAAMNSQGIGLGLLIVKQVVESSGGSISVTSQGVGHGSKFSFSMSMEEVVIPNVN